MTDAAKLTGITLVNLNKTPAAEVIKAPKMTPKFKTVVESAKIGSLRL